MKPPRLSIVALFRLVALFITLFVAPGAGACDLQRGNEVYLDARAEVAALSPRDKERVAQDWSELEAEQKSLWALAGQIDDECRRGELSSEVVPYNARVYDWQDRLRKFLKRMRTPVESPSAQPDPQPVQGTEAGRGSSEVEFPGAGAPKPPAKAPPQTPPPRKPEPAPAPLPTNDALAPKALL